MSAVTGRVYKPYEYVGAPDADKVIVLMGSGSAAVEEAVNYLNAQGKKVGVLKVWEGLGLLGFTGTHVIPSSNVLAAGTHARTPQVFGFGDLGLVMTCSWAG